MQSEPIRRVIGWPLFALLSFSHDAPPSFRHTSQTHRCGARCRSRGESVSPSSLLRVTLLTTASSCLQNSARGATIPFATTSRAATTASYSQRVPAIDFDRPGSERGDQRSRPLVGVLHRNPVRALPSPRRPSSHRRNTADGHSSTELPPPPVPRDSCRRRRIVRRFARRLESREYRTDDPSRRRARSSQSRRCLPRPSRARDRGRHLSATFRLSLNPVSIPTFLFTSAFCMFLQS